MGSLEGAINFFMNLSADVRWGHSGYWLAVNANRIVGRDKDCAALLDRVRSRPDRNEIYVEFLP